MADFSLKVLITVCPQITMLSITVPAVDAIQVKKKTKNCRYTNYSPQPERGHSDRENTHSCERMCQMVT